MAAIAPITIADGKSTPESHVFNPIASVPPTYRRNGVAGQSLVAQERMIIKVVPAKTPSGVNRVQIQMVVPVSEVPAGGTGSGYIAPPGVAHEMTVKIEFLLHQRSELAGRKDLRVLASNLLKDAAVLSAVDNLEQPY